MTPTPPHSFSIPETSRGRVKTISGSGAVHLHADSDTIFVDVRGSDEIARTGTIKGAIRAPLPEFARHADATGNASLPAASADKTIILVCASGARSAAAANQLVDLGYKQVATISGGIGQWKMADGPIER